jgi:hypothetical protein
VLLRGFVFVPPGVTLGGIGVGEAAGAVDGEGGSAVPDCDWTSEMSELLINPLTVTSSRKLFEVTGCPDWAWV